MLAVWTAVRVTERAARERLSGRTAGHAVRACAVVRARPVDSRHRHRRGVQDGRPLSDHGNRVVSELARLRLHVADVTLGAAALVVLAADGIRQRTTTVFPARQLAAGLSAQALVFVRTNDIYAVAPRTRN